MIIQTYIKHNIKQTHYRMTEYSLTVQALFVDDSTAGQCFVILLITHQCVHAQNGFQIYKEGKKAE